MNSINIPERFRPIFKEFLSLSVEVRDQIIDKFIESRPDQETSDIADLIAEGHPELKSFILKLTAMFISLHQALNAENLSPNEISAGIVKALQRLGDEYPIDNNLQGQLDRLFDKKSQFGVVSKAMALLAGREKLITSTRIITDIRPVFAEDDDCTVRTNIIIHNLVVTYRDANDEKEIYFALSGKDLDKLKTDIDRSSRKEKTIRENGIIGDFLNLDA